jgi:hypothetical protein
MVSILEIIKSNTLEICQLMQGDLTEKIT